jgi:hypothetical protein
MPPKGSPSQGSHPALQWFVRVDTADGQQAQCLRCNGHLSVNILTASDRTRQMANHLASKKCRMAAATPAAVAAAGVTATLDGASATSIPSVIGPPSASVAPLSTGLPAAPSRQSPRYRHHARGGVNVDDEQLLPSLDTGTGQ